MYSASFFFLRTESYPTGQEPTSDMSGLEIKMTLVLTDFAITCFEDLRLVQTLVKVKARQAFGQLR